MKSIAVLVAIIFSSVTNLFCQSSEKTWETDHVFKTPESVWYDEARDQIYVSNINGKSSDKDNNGFIALLNSDGTVKTLHWVTGMNAPKGMVVIGDLLYVTDIDRFHVIDIDNARIIKTVEIDSAKFLNDMAADDDGNIYISDTRENHLLKYDGKKTEVWLTGDLIVSPNGLAFYDKVLYSGTRDNLLKVDVKSKDYEVLVAGTGSIDGLIPLGDDRFIISNWAGKVTLVSPTNKTVLSNTTDEKIQAADLGYIPSQKMILIPTFTDNRVVAEKLTE